MGNLGAMMTYRQRLRANIRAELGRADRRQADAAELLGFSETSMTQRMTGKRDFHLGELLAIAHWLKVPLATLLDGVDEYAHEEEQASR